MKLTGSYQINLEKQKVWEALNNPKILQKSIPGCEDFKKNSDNEFTARATNKIGPFNASFTGDIQLKEINAPNSYVIEGSGNAPVGFASGEAKVNLEDVETVLALTNDDEDNLMVSVLVEKFAKDQKNIDDKRTMALINKPNYSLLQSSLKIDDLIDPRMNTVSSILKHVHKGTIENAYSVLNGEYEVIEAEIIESSELVNKELKNSNLPDDIRIGSIIRGEEIILPSSKYVFQNKDIVILLSKRDQLPTVENMFRISSI